MNTDIPPNSVLAGTGHRPDKIGAQEVFVRLEIHARLVMYTPSMIISGMALGFDTWWAEAAIERDIPFVAAVPYLGQQERWPRADQERYLKLLTTAARVVCLHNERPKNHETAARWLQERNEWMVDNALGLIACHNGDPSGGTINCIRYARARAKPIDVFDPYRYAMEGPPRE